MSDTLRQIKGSSSSWVSDTFPDLGAFTWQVGYAAFSVSYSKIDSVKHYLAIQAEHHQSVTFQDELREFLRKHDIAFDEQYMWD